MLAHRLDISGDIDSNTPCIVLEEIADASSIKFEKNNSPLYISKLINRIYRSREKKYEIKDDINSLRLIARFVNSKCKNWKKAPLIQAYEFMLKTKDIKDIKIPFDYGLQTPEKIEKLNACVLYRLCKKYNIKTDYDTSIEDMVKSITIYSYIFLPNLMHVIKMRIFDALRFECNDSDLVNILYLVDSKIQDKKKFGEVFQEEFHNTFEKEKMEREKERGKEKEETYNYEDYRNCAQRINLNEDGKPKNDLEAIVMAALNYKIDLTNCKYPITEYGFLSQTPYFPYDENLIDRIRESVTYPDSLQNPYLNKVFNPLLPENMYLTRDLISLCGEEGLNVPDDNYYSALQMVYLTENFTHGKQGHIANNTNTFLEKIDDLEYDKVVIYGVRNSYNSVRAFTYGELSDTFSNYKRFSDPSSNELFSNESIEKLFLLTQKEKRVNESDESYNERIELGEEIERVKMYISCKNKSVDEFTERYEKLDEDGRNKLEKALTCLLHTSMYMRNWDGIGNYPLKSEQTTYENEKQIEIDHRVTQSLIALEAALEELNIFNNLGNFILELPLMQYSHENKIFVTSNDESEGLTIRDRLIIVRGGEDSSLSSCIRLSSNKFGSTAYYYMILLGFRIGFSIEELANIF